MTGPKAEKFTKTEREIEQAIKRLSRSEAAILFYKSEGLHLEEIAGIMGYTVRRISDFSSWMYAKLGFSSSIHRQRTKRQEILENHYFPVVKKILAALPGEKIAEKLDHWSLVDKPNLQLNPETRDLVKEDLLEEYRDHLGVLEQQEELIKELLEQRQWNVGLVEQDLRENFREQGEVLEAYQRILKKLLEQREWKVRGEIEVEIDRVEKRDLVPPPVIPIPPLGDEGVRKLLGARRNRNIGLIIVVSALICLALTTTSYISYRIGQRVIPLPTSQATPSTSPQLETATSEPTFEPTQLPTETATIAATSTDTPFIPSPTNPPSPTALPTATPTPLPTATPIPATPVPTLIPEPSVSLPFFDNFDTGLNPAWQEITGQWRMVNGQLTADPGDGESVILVGDERWTDYYVDVDVFNYDWNYSIWIIVRAKEGSYVVMETNCCDTSWILFTGPTQNKFATSDEGGLSFSGFNGFAKNHIHLEVVGQTFTVYIDGKQFLQTQDSILASGKIGLAFEYHSDQTPRFDNFKVEAAP